MPSEDAPAVTVEQVSKRYFLRGRGARALKTALITLPALLLNGRARHEFWALQDLSFTVRRSECLGLVGPNGSGKSSLLRIIAQITPPTQGRVTTSGRVSALLELGAGFHPQLTGRENALLNAVLLGLNRREAREALPEIIAFSELGEFIDQPMHTYSSGMYMRLGFSVAVHVQPEILLVDEVMAVGDAEFQSKCYTHMERLRAAGVTIIMASHDLSAIQRYTDRVLLLDQGRIALEGRPADVLHEYLLRVFGAKEAAGAER
jgi:ABC-type polysaccharide/polyol phosphate transport system ATPase subunit